MDSAPQDVLAEVFRRLAPRSLAICRRVCKAWHAAVDASRLLRADLLPLTLDGVIFETSTPDTARLFSHRSTGRKVTTRLDYLDCPRDFIGAVEDCCNGLLLLPESDHVVNPATRQWVRLPPPPRSCVAADCRSCFGNRYIVYDPALSPHYQVFSIPSIPRRLPTGHVAKHVYDGQLVSAMEWPPSPYIMHVFSSQTGVWEEKPFIRQGDPAGTIGVVKSVYQAGFPLFYTAYWKGALYVRCEEDSVMRIDLFHDKYRVIKLPEGKKGYHEPRLGKSKNGVYCVFHEWHCTFQVWFLDESHGQIGWILKTDINLQTVVKNLYSCLDDGPWSLQSDAQGDCVLKNLEPVDDNRGVIVEDNFDWDTDNGYIVGTTDGEKRGNPTYFCCLGFHPYKEILLFHGGMRTVAYYFDSSKARDLGKMECGYMNEMRESFSYAACWMRNLPGSN